MEKDSIVRFEDGTGYKADIYSLYDFGLYYEKYENDSNIKLFNIRGYNYSYYGFTLNENFMYVGNKYC